MTTLTPRSLRAIIATVGVASLTGVALTGCSAPDGSATTTITIMGPNQWTSDTKTFGPAWDELIERFEKDNPEIEVKTNVLPISEWAATSAAQLTSGTAPELIFNQTTHKPDQVVSLDDYLDAPNPFSDSGNAWIDDFDPKYFGDAQRNAVGDFEWIPFNLVAVGIFYNEDLLADSGVEPADLETFDGFIRACDALRKDGVQPLGVDNGPTAVGWSNQALSSMLLNDLVPELNTFDTAGDPGSADVVTAKSQAAAILDGRLDLTKTPELAAQWKLLKKFFDSCATDNWSGVQAQGSFSGGTAFPAGKTAMSFGTVFSAASLDESDFSWSTVPFPALSTDDSEFASGEPAQFGVGVGGTSYMIPSYIEGDKREAAVRFLQYMTSPKAEDWLAKTGGLSAVAGVEAPDSMAALTSSAWSTIPALATIVNTPATPSGGATLEGYLIGSRTLEEALEGAQENNLLWANEQVEQNGWNDLK